MIRAYAKKRGWHDLRFLSSYHNSFNKDMGVERPAWFTDSAQNPGMSVFRYEEGKGNDDGTSPSGIRLCRSLLGRMALSSVEWTSFAPSGICLTLRLRAVGIGRPDWIM